MNMIPSIREATAMPAVTLPALTPGTTVRCTRTGELGTIVHGYDPADPWLPVPSQRRAGSVNVRYGNPLRGCSAQRDELASDVQAI